MGFYQERFLFSTRVSHSQLCNFHLLQSDGDKYVLGAGAAHGVICGAEFTVYKGQDSDWSPKTSPLDIFVVLETSAFFSIMDVPPGRPRPVLAQPAFTFQTKSGTEEELRLHVAMDTGFTTVFGALRQEIQCTDPRHRKILLVEKHHAELHVAIDDGHVVFNIQNRLVTLFGMTRIPFKVRPDINHVCPVIRAAAHYYWHLRRTNRIPILKNKICIEFTKVEVFNDDDFCPEMQPVGLNLNAGGVVDLVDSDDMYGIKIVNSSSLAVYPSLFFFDNTNLSISKYDLAKRNFC